MCTRKEYPLSGSKIDFCFFAFAGALPTQGAKVMAVMLHGGHATSLEIIDAISKLIARADEFFLG